MKNFWLYLEPFSFIFRDIDKYLIYNSLNGEMALFSDPISLKYISELDKKYSGYCITITEQELESESLKTLIKKIRDIYAGDFIECSGDNKPFIFKPILNLLDNSISDDVSSNYYFEENLLEYLHEFSIYLGEGCNNECKYCSMYYKQFLFCTKEKSETRLKNDNYIDLLNQLAIIGIKNINIIISKINDFNIINEIKENEVFKNITFNFFINIKNINKEILEKILNVKNFILNCIIDNEDIKKINTHLFLEFKSCIRYFFVVTSMYDLEFIESLINKYDIEINLLPFYNNYNDDFFHKNVFITRNDLQDNIVSKQQIYARQIINENMFGKLILFPNGEIYANVNKKSLGNILRDSLSKIIYEEKKRKEAWFITREMTTCKQCVYRLLCPSISNYEFVFGKANLCNIKK